jgi:hypothetical protein
MYVHMHLVGLQNFIIPEYLLFLVLGCNMGHTIPTPVHTIPVMAWVQYLQVTGAVLLKTCGTS